MLKTYDARNDPNGTVLIEDQREVRVLRQDGGTVPRKISSEYEQDGRSSLGKGRIHTSSLVL